jgi:type VI secretion system FHA domain protein
MILTLEVSTPPGGTPPSDERRIFRETGGTIGRAPGNDLVLPDSYVSSRHARISYVNGAFQLEDMSTNGVSVNSPDHRLVRGQPYTLKAGDRIFIDPYEIRVSMSAEPVKKAPPPFTEDPFGLVDVPPPTSGHHSGHQVSPMIPEPSGGADVDPLSLLDLDPGRARTPAPPRAADLQRGSLMNEHYRPPTPVAPPPGPLLPPEPAGGGVIPDDYDPLMKSEVKMRTAPPPRPAPPPPPAPAVETPARPVAAPPPVRERAPELRPQPGGPAFAPPPPRSEPRVEPRSETTIDLADVLAGAGITGVTVTPEIARDFGRVLQVVVSGLMEVLQARQRIKDEFRLRVTSFKPSQNNPLKFSANVEDALHNLLVKRNPAYLGTVDAFEDAFDDVRNHQMAMLEGVRVAFEAMLKAFDPDALQQEFDKHGKASLISMGAKSRYWDQYREKFSDMVSDADACFRELFGHEFAKAYEAQLERLKSQGRSRRSRS